ncbi:MAG: hypothetical protein IJ516_05785 [Phascolarctobacterium sp.]|nr:hypothetical protein [Phascolarctobacterium sp.]
MNEVEQCGQLRQRVCPVCGKSFILPTGGSNTYQYVFVDRSVKNAGKRSYLCSWHCLRQKQYEWIAKKKKYTIRDIRWLEANGYEVPEEKKPKWVREEERKDKRGI